MYPVIWRYQIVTCILLIFASSNLVSQDLRENDKLKSSFYVGYDLGEMAFNKFQNFAGEVAWKFKNHHSIRFVYLNVKLTEQHLSSNFARAVDGENVTGLWHGYDLYYDVPMYHFSKGRSFIYGGLSAGYHKNLYQHTVLDQSVEHKTATLGFNLGFRETNLFKTKGLYSNFSIPFRYNFNKLEETKLGDSTVNKSVFNQTISFFIGYEF